MPKKWQTADKRADGGRPGDAVAVRMPEHRARQIMGKTPKRTLFEDFLASGKADKCG